MSTIILKGCSKCAVILPFTSFYKDTSKKDGLTSYCKTCSRNKSKERRQTKSGEVRIYKATWFQENKERLRLKSAQAQTKYRARNKNNPVFILKKRLRDRLARFTLRKNISTTNCFNYFGCSDSELIRHIENQFQVGMTWDNRGEWHLDHIYPLSRAKSTQHLFELNHYTNLQPLWAKDNLRKSNNV